MSVFTVVILVTLLLINDHQTVTSFTRYIITYNSYTSRPNIHEPLYTVQIQALLSTTETATRSHWTNTSLQIMLFESTGKITTKTQHVLAASLLICCFWAKTCMSHLHLCLDQSETWHSLEQYCSILHLLQTISNARLFTTLQWKHNPVFGCVFLASKCIFFKHEHAVLLR